MMRCACPFGCAELQALIRDYEKIQSLAVRLIYGQIVCSLIGSLGALYNGVLLVNLGISLFALVAIESGNQNLARTYAVLLFSSILIDVFWFILFASDIWHIPSETYGAFVSFSAKLTLAMQIIGFSLKSSSMLVWIQMYRLGVSSYIGNSISRDTDIESRNSFLSPGAPSMVRRRSVSDDVVGGSAYDPASYSPLFEDGRDDTYLLGVGQNHFNSEIESVTAADTSHVHPSTRRLTYAKDDENAGRKPQNT